jgi:hypothetical protein
MADTGWLIAGTGAEAGGGDESWSGESNITADDGSNATCSISARGDSSNRLRATNFGFSIPIGATIDGIEARVQVSVTSGSADIATIRLVQGGLQKGLNRASFEGITGSPVNYDYGGPSDLWGVSWSDSDVNLSTFGFDFQAEAVGTTINLFVDAMWIKVHYTEVASGGNLIWPIT